MIYPIPGSEFKLVPSRHVVFLRGALRTPSPGTYITLPPGIASSRSACWRVPGPSAGGSCGGDPAGGSCAPRRQRDIVLISRHREIGRVASPGAVHEINENESSPGCCRAPYQAAGSLGRLVPHRDLVYLEFFQPPKKEVVCIGGIL